MKTLNEYITEQINEWLENSNANKKLIDKYLKKLSAWCKENGEAKREEWEKLREEKQCWLVDVIYNDDNFKKVIEEIFPIYKKYPNCPYLWPLYDNLWSYVYYDKNEYKYDENPVYRDVVELYSKTLEKRKEFNKAKQESFDKWYKENRDKLIKSEKEKAKYYNK